MRVLVTGGAGFIGSHLCERLLGEGHEIAIIDELNDFYSPDEKRANLAEIRKVGSYEFWQQDITDGAKILSVVSKFEPEVVVHLAARAGVRPSLEAPVLYEQANVIGTLNLLEACRGLSKKPKFVFGSSSSVYGISRRVPFREDDPLDCPVSPYAVSKLAGEKYCFSYSHLYGIPTVCLRFFTVYGPRQRPDLAIRKFTELIQMGRPIPFFGNGKTARDYTYISDIVEGITKALSLQCSHEVINLGNSNPVSLDGMVTVLEGVIGVPAKFEYYAEQPGDVPTTFADTAKAARILSYQPKMAFQAGIRSFVDWFSKGLNRGEK